MKTQLQRVCCALCLCGLAPQLALAEVHTIGSIGNRPPLKISKGEIPSNQQYLKFMQWHEKQSVLSLVVSGADREALKNSLQQLAELKRRGVLIGEIILIGSDSAELLASTAGEAPLSKGKFENALTGTSGRKQRVPDELYRNYRSLLESRTEQNSAATALGLKPPGVINSQEVLARFDLTYSPAWIVRFEGRNYIYEGNFDPRRLFFSDGSFRGDDAGR